MKAPFCLAPISKNELLLFIKLFWSHKSHIKALHFTQFHFTIDSFSSLPLWVFFCFCFAKVANKITINIIILSHAQFSHLHNNCVYECVFVWSKVHTGAPREWRTKIKWKLTNGEGKKAKKKRTANIKIADPQNERCKRNVKNVKWCFNNGTACQALSICVFVHQFIS